MSRNLCKTACDQCGLQDFTLGEVYALPDDHHWCPGMKVRDVTCKVCGTRYIGWVGATGDAGLFGGPGYGARDCDVAETRDHGFYDLSYRSTFNDEPGSDDLPGDVEVMRVTKVGGRVVDEQELDVL